MIEENDYTYSIKWEGGVLARYFLLLYACTGFIKGISVVHVLCCGPISLFDVIAAS